MDPLMVLIAVIIVGIAAAVLIAAFIYRRSKANKDSRYGRSQRIFGTVFILSGSFSVIMFLIYFLRIFQVSASPYPYPSAPPPIPAGPNIMIITGVVAALTSCLTSITTFIGFVITAILGIRKEGRDSRMSELERQRQEIDLERQKLELKNAREEIKKQKGEK